MVNGERNQGFTLLELIVTVAVAGIILSFGVPGFIGFVQNNRATTDTNDLVTALNLARSEAIRRSAPVTVCSSPDGASCGTDTDWSGGWIVLSSTNDVLRVWPARNGGSGVVESSEASPVEFDARGALVGSSAPIITVEQPDCTGNNKREVSVNAAGRISLDREACS